MRWRRRQLWALAVLAACTPSTVPPSSGPVLSATTSPAGSSVIGSARVATQESQSIDGVDVDLRSCELVGAGVIRFGGSITIPADLAGDEVAFTAGLMGPVTNQGDSLIDTVRLAVRVTASGAFDFEVERLSAEQAGEVVEIDPSIDNVVECALTSDFVATWNWVPLTVGDFAEIQYADGALQALGEGAQLGDLTDPRLVYAYLAHLEWDLPFDTIWAPNPQTGVLTRALVDYRDPTEPCPRLELRVSEGEGEGSVAQTHRCDPFSNGSYLGSEAVATGRPVPEAPGFEWWDDDGPVAALVDGDLIVTVRSGSAELTETIAGSLRAFKNAHVSPRASHLDG